MLQRLRALISRHRQPRQTRLYGVGGPRTGTHSVAAIFGRSLRSRHEPWFRRVTRSVLDHHHGRISADDLRRFVRRRDERLRLDVDSSHANVFLLDALLAEFVDARFLLTIRDCFSWLDSAIDHTLNARVRSAADREYLEFYFAAQHVTYTRHDEALRERGLLSIDCYLAAWNRHNLKVLTTVPPERLLVVRTDRLAANLREIAQFAGVGAECIDPGFRPAGRARARHRVLAMVDAQYLADRAMAQCGDLMLRFFPDLRSPQDAPSRGGGRP